MRRVHSSVLSLTFTLGVTFSVGCSSEDPGSDGSGGSSGSANGSGGSSGSAGSGAAGGSAGSGGSTTGGASSSGGTSGSSNGGGSGGAQGGSAGASGSGGSAGSGGSGGSIPGLDTCPMPPAGATPAAVTALNAINTLRLAMGIECMELIPELSTAAQNHCDYYATNEAAGEDQCTANAHNEVESCTGFTGASPGNRVDAAGYEGFGWSEVMAFANDPEEAVAMWINSVYHRTPLVSPWWRHMGYGGAEDCDTIDLGPGPNTPDDVTATYPYDGQSDLPLEFHGDREGPTPPEPDSGWPSGIPIHVYAKDAEIVSQSVEVMGTDAPLELVLVDHDAQDDEFIFYPAEPLEPSTTYRVRVSLTQDSTAHDFDWTFTTGN